MGCPACGVVTPSHGRRKVELIDAPSFGRPVRVMWRKRTWSCPEPCCPVGVFTEQDERVAQPRALLTTRACWWAIRQMRRENASVRGLARQLGAAWKTVWRSIKPLLQAMDGDPARFEGVQALGVDDSPARCALRREVPRYLFGGPRVRVAGRLPRYGFGAPDDACLGWCCRRGRWP
ncbi:MAG: transposase family protein, partial [Actinomycetota bacterium]|nr:transposase family protein [Actinomycetota bacterium]